MVEQQPVFGTARENMQREAHPPQESLAAFQPPQLPGRQELMLDELVEGLDAEMPLGDPADHLDVAQASGASLYVWFEVVARVMVAMVSGDLLAALLSEKLLWRPDAVRSDRFLHGFEECFGARNQARLHQRRRHRQVRDGLLDALLHGAHAVPDVEADIPQRGNECRQRVLRVGVDRLRQQQHDVDVGAGVQFAAAVAANGHERHVLGQLAHVGLPQVAEQFVDSRRALVYEVDDGLSGEKPTFQVGVGRGQRGPAFSVRLHQVSVLHGLFR